MQTCVKCKTDPAIFYFYAEKERLSGYCFECFKTYRSFFGMEFTISGPALRKYKELLTKS